MSLVEKIGLAFRRKKETTKDAYFRALRDGDPEAIATTAVAAGVSSAQIESDATVLDRATELGAVAVNFPRLQEVAAKAVRSAEAAQAKLDATVKPLEEAANQAFLVAQEAQRQEREARTAVSALTGLYNEYPRLLDHSTMPVAVKDQAQADAAREAAEGVAHATVKKLVDAEKRVNEARSFLNRVQYGKWPYDIPSYGGGVMFDPAELEKKKPDVLAQAIKDLATAEAELEAAKSAEAKG